MLAVQIVMLLVGKDQVLKPEACPVVLLWLVMAIHLHSTAAGTAMFAPLTW